MFNLPSISSNDFGSSRSPIIALTMRRFFSALLMTDTWAKIKTSIEYEIMNIDYRCPFYTSYCSLLNSINQMHEIIMSFDAIVYLDQKYDELQK